MMQLTQADGLVAGTVSTGPVVPDLDIRRSLPSPHHSAIELRLECLKIAAHGREHHDATIIVSEADKLFAFVMKGTP